MRLGRLLAIARKEVIQIRRDRRSLAMAFLLPLLLLFLYGHALTLDVDRLRTVVHDQDRSLASRELVARFTASRYFALVAVAGSQREVEGAIASGAAQVGLVVPRHFARDLGRGERVPVQVLLDGSDANTAMLAQAYAEAIGVRYTAEAVAARAGWLAREPPLEARLRVWYNPELKSRNYIIPGLIAVIMMVISALLTSLTVAREWERGTMEPLVATPVRVPELVVGKLLPYFAIGLLDVVFSTLVGTLGFGVPFRGSVALLVALTLAFLLGVQGLGILISIRMRSQVLASQVALTVTFLPAFLLSGFVFDLASLPVVLRAISHAVVARYFVTIVKAIFLKGAGPEAMAPAIVFLVLFALAVTALALRAFRKRLV